MASLIASKGSSAMINKKKKNHKSNKQIKNLMSSKKIRDIPILAAESISEDPNYDSLTKRKLIALDGRYKIYYFIPHFPPNTEQASPFGWYSHAIQEAANLIIYLSGLPADLRDPYIDIRQVLFRRLARLVWPHIVPIQTDALGDIFDRIASPFRVLASSNEAVANWIDEFIATTDIPCLHISTVKGPGRLSVEDLSVERILIHCRSVVDLLQNHPTLGEFANFAKEQMDSLKPYKARIHRLTKSLHNVTKPNEQALIAFRRKLPNTKPLRPEVLPNTSLTKVYIDQICRSADAVMTERNQLLEGIGKDIVDYRYIIALQGMYWGHFSGWRERISSANDEDKKTLVLAYKSAVQAKSYVDMWPNIDLQDMENGLFKSIMAQRSLDARAFTAGLSILATASLAPVIRLEPRLNEARGDLKQLARFVRGRSKLHYDQKLSRLASAASNKMRSLVDPKFLSRIDKPEETKIEGIKLISDLPLELIKSNGIPLCMRFDVSRGPVLPGNLYITNCIAPPRILSINDFIEVLVIRSFNDNDPLKNVLERCINSVLSKGSELKSEENINIKVRFVDVQSEDDFVKAVNGFDGALMIFDGHGSYDESIGSGMMVVGENPIDAWQLKRRCRMPPIVLFSACDTQPIDGSHSSVATSALALGARTVLATTLEIDGVKAGIFIGRMILRMSQLLPMEARNRSIFTWREFISGMLRMTHVTEVFLGLRKNGRLAYRKLDFERTQLPTNIAINARDPNWYSGFIENISKQTGLCGEVISSDIEKWVSLTDSMKYIQLGSPENVIIVDRPLAEIAAEEAARNGAGSQSLV